MTNTSIPGDPIVPSSPMAAFMQQYEREFDFYSSVAQHTARQCEAALTEEGIRHFVTFRAKRLDRLKDKLVKRNRIREYADIDSIRNDIVDLAGVRVGLYFPGDRPVTEAKIEELFDVEKNGRKVFPESLDDDSDAIADPYQKRFTGYCATHYRVRNRVSDLAPQNSRYSNALVEIQIASVLMLAWAEVDHDLAYKPLTGSLSVDELAILDEVNGLVIAGEIAFERLQRVMEQRVKQKDQPFANHFDLASYIDRQIRTQRDSEDQA